MAGPGIVHEDLEFLKDLAYTSGLRGLDGTGFLQAGAFKRAIHYEMEKGSAEISYFMWYHRVDKEGNKRLLNSTADNVFMGHCRAATKGGISDENAHPFDVGRHIGAHNGTLFDSKYQKVGTTDSELMFKDIEERGFETVLKELDKGSAFAISMFDKTTGELIFARNDKRSLCYAYHNKRKVFYWASEGAMLQFIAQRSNYGMGMDIGKIFRFSENTVYRVHPLSVNAGSFPEYKARMFTPNWIKEEQRENEEKDKAPLIVHDTKERENLTNVLLLNPPKRPLNLNIQKPPIKSELLKPCVYCKTPLDLLAQYEGVEIEPHHYICKSCDKINKEMAEEHLKKHSPAHSNKGIMH